MGAVIAVANLKGGVGKSTLAVNVASALADGAAVELLDADAQGTSTDWGAAGALPITVTPLALEDMRSRDAWIDAVMAAKARTDFVVIDLPPHLDAVIKAAFVVADRVLVPVTPSGADIRATVKALGLMREARKVRGDGKPACLLVPSRVDRRTAAGREIEAVLHGLGEPVAPAIAQRAGHVDAFTSGQWIGQFSPGSAAHHEVAALASIIRRIPHGA